MAQEEIILDVLTNEMTVRPYTAAEIAKTEKAAVELEAQKVEAQKVEAQKAALLVKLGITSDEAKLLLS